MYSNIGSNMYLYSIPAAAASNRFSSTHIEFEVSIGIDWYRNVFILNSKRRCNDCIVLVSMEMVVFEDLLFLFLFLLFYFDFGHGYSLV